MHYVVFHVQRLQQRQRPAHSLVQLGDAVVADVEVEEERVRGQRPGGQRPQVVVRHVQAGDVPGKVGRDRLEAQVAAVGSAALHLAGGLLLGGRAIVLARHEMEHYDRRQEEEGAWGMHRFKALKRNTMKDSNLHDKH